MGMEEKRVLTMRGEMFVAFMWGLVPSEAGYIEREVEGIEDAAKAQERERIRRGVSEAIDELHLDHAQCAVLLWAVADVASRDRSMKRANIADPED